MKTLKARIGRSKFPCLKEIVWSLQWKMDLENLWIICLFHVYFEPAFPLPEKTITAPNFAFSNHPTG